MSELRLLGCAVLLNLGVAAVLGVGIARHLVGAVPKIASVQLTELVAEHAERASRRSASVEETATETRAWVAALEHALDRVADRHGAVLLPVRSVAAGADDMTAEVRAEMTRALTAAGSLAESSFPAARGTGAKEARP